MFSIYVLCFWVMVPLSNFAIFVCVYICDHCRYVDTISMFIYVVREFVLLIEFKSKGEAF